MKRSAIHATIVILIGLAAGLVVLSKNDSRLSAALAAGNPSNRTLARKYDVIKLKGHFLNAFIGAPIGQLSLLAQRDGKLSPIPFQIDERDPAGRLIMTRGKIARRGENKGLLVGNDDLLFMVADAGDRLPDAERADKIEIEITDPRYRDQKAWAYLARFTSGKPPRSTIDYVNYNPSTERIISDKYILGYRKGFMFYNEVIYPPSAGGNGTNFFDRIKVRFRAEMFNGKVVIVRNEDAVKAEVQGWIDGPIRVVQATVNYVKLFDQFPPISFNSMSEYYHQIMGSPITVRIPFDLNTAIKILGVRSLIADIVGDHPGMMGGMGYTNLSPEGFEYTGHMPLDLANKLPKKGIEWGFATKKGVGTWFPRLIFPDPVYQYNYFYFADDVNKKNTPDDIPGEIAGGVRLDIKNFPRELLDILGKESFMLKFETYFAPPGLTAAGAKEWLDIQDYPLLVDVKSSMNSGQTSKGSGASGKGPPWKCGCNGAITDVMGRKISLKGIAFFIGDIDVDARAGFGGEHVSDRRFYEVKLSKIAYFSNYVVESDPYTKIKNATFSKIKMTDGSTMDLMTCRACGWAGADDEGRVVYIINSQIKRIDFFHAK